MCRLPSQPPFLPLSWCWRLIPRLCDCSRLNYIRASLSAFVSHSCRCCYRFLAVTSLYFREFGKQIGTKNVDIFTISPHWGEKGYWFLFYAEDETRPENTHIMGSVLGERDLISRFSLFSLTETIALGLFKYRVKMELKPFPQLFQKRNDSDLAGGRIPIHSRPGRVLFLWVHFSERLGLFFSLEASFSSDSSVPTKCTCFASKNG